MNMKMKKKGMALGDLYPAILALVLVGILIGVAVIVLSNFASTAGIPAAASTAINQTSTGIASFSTWIGLIVIIIAAAVIIGLVIRSFGGRQ